MVDVSCGGTFMLKSENKAWTLFENPVENPIQHVLSSRMMLILRALKTERLFDGDYVLIKLDESEYYSQKIVFQDKQE
jgi:hypothetical protein